MSRPPRIGVIGGVDRCTALLERTAETLGCRLEHHCGRTSGPKSSELDALVARVDLLIILTDTNSHAAVGKARRLAAAYDRKHVLARRISPSRLMLIVADNLDVAA
jgi:predicted dehydrogenase